MSYLKATICGHLGNDAPVNTVNGETVVNMSIAHSEKWTDAQGNKKEKTTWVSASWWTTRTNIVPYLKKGGLILCEGTPEARNYNSKTGETVAQLSLRVTNVTLLGGNKENSQSSGGQSYAPPAGGGSDISDAKDDLPF